MPKYDDEEQGFFDKEVDWVGAGLLGRVTSSLSPGGNWSRNKSIMNFEYEHVERVEDVRQHIQECEGKHTQQAMYSTFHDALTQICFGCKKVRSTIKRV